MQSPEKTDIFLNENWNSDKCRRRRKFVGTLITEMIEIPKKNVFPNPKINFSVCGELFRRKHMKFYCI